MALPSTISESYDAHVQVQRRVSNGKDPAGQPIEDLPIIFANLPCTTQSDQNNLIMPIAGQVTLDYRTMYCDLVDIRTKDIVTIIQSNSGLNVGNKYLVVQTTDYSEPEMEHLEVSLQGGV